MRKDMWKRGIVVGIIMLFVGASVIPSALSKNHSPMNHISEKLMLTNPANVVEELVIYMGNITVTWKWTLMPIIKAISGECIDVWADCSTPTNITYNMTYPGLLKIITIVNITLVLEAPYKIYRGGNFQSDLRINGEFINLKDTTIRQKIQGKYNDTQTIIHEREISENTTLNLHSELGASPILLIPLSYQFEWCGQNTTIFVKLQ